MVNSQQLDQLARHLIENSWFLVTAESCTGGGIAQTMTTMPGSSTWFDRGFVTYSNDSKQEMLDVPASLLEQNGAVSEEVVRAMTQGALAHSRAQIALAVTGVAGPGGGSQQKPVGTVWIAWGRETQTYSRKYLFTGDRQNIRAQSEAAAIQGLLDFLKIRE